MSLVSLQTLQKLPETFLVPDKDIETYRELLAEKLTIIDKQLDAGMRKSDFSKYSMMKTSVQKSIDLLDKVLDLRKK